MIPVWFFCYTFYPFNRHVLRQYQFILNCILCIMFTLKAYVPKRMEYFHFEAVSPWWERQIFKRRTILRIKYFIQSINQVIDIMQCYAFCLSEFFRFFFSKFYCLWLRVWFENIIQLIQWNLSGNSFFQLSID